MKKSDEKVTYTPRIVIILVNWNGCSDTVACLNSLMCLQDQDISIIVCDNGSVDNSISALLDWGKKLPDGGRRGVCLIKGIESSKVTLLNSFLTIIDIGANLGFAGANNIAIKLALAEPTVEAVWLLNNDTEVDQETLLALRRRVAEDPSIGICGSTLIYSNDRDKIQALGVHFSLLLAKGIQIACGASRSRLPSRKEVERQITYVPGASMYVTRQFLQTVGLLEERYFLFFEELDWSLRNRGRFRLGWAPASIVYHKEGASIGTLANGRASDLSIYYQNVNLLRLTARFKPYLLPFPCLRLFLITARFLLRRDSRAASVVMKAGKDFVIGRYRKGGGWLSNKPQDTGALRKARGIG